MIEFLGHLIFGVIGEGVEALIRKIFKRPVKGFVPPKSKRRPRPKRHKRGR